MKQFFETILCWMNKHKIILLIILVGIGLFYWFQLRPTQIREHCFDLATKAITKSKSDTLNSTEDYDFLYKLCLQRNGVEK